VSCAKRKYYLPSHVHYTAKKWPAIERFDIARPDTLEQMRVMRREFRSTRHDRQAIQTQRTGIGEGASGE
jgi:hypothetical protein